MGTYISIIISFVIINIYNLVPKLVVISQITFTGKLTYDENPTETADTGFSTVEESDIGKKTVNRGKVGVYVFACTRSVKTHFDWFQTIN